MSDNRSPDSIFRLVESQVINGSGKLGSGKTAPPNSARPPVPQGSGGQSAQASITPPPSK
jgi:hypothetical protein